MFLVDNISGKQAASSAGKCEHIGQ